MMPDKRTFALPLPSRRSGLLRIFQSDRQAAQPRWSESSRIQSATLRSLLDDPCHDGWIPS